mmetsp:Transcript_10277/g.15646  ORF Transcript_10277/g.15646 Transcript_10277/m.15646 type:complete len:97 (+) Transcript_10277:574-864(+)
MLTAVLLLRRVPRGNHKVIDYRALVGVGIVGRRQEVLAIFDLFSVSSKEGGAVWCREVGVELVILDPTLVLQPQRLVVYDSHGGDDHRTVFGEGRR